MSYPAGRRCCCWRLGSRDGGVRRRRRRLDVRRDIDKMLSLGYGAHHCLGASAAACAGRAGPLLERFPD